MRAIDTWDGEGRFVDYPTAPPPPKTPPPVITPTLPPLQTGGPNPPVPVVQPVPRPPMTTGGPLPPTQVTTTTLPPLKTGGPLPPTKVTTNLQTGGPNPPVPYTPGTGAPNGNTGVVPPNPYGPAQTVEDMVNHFINGRYAQNARLRGMEVANQRGLINSSLAAGASSRAALESVQPFVSEGMSLLNNRESRAQTALEAERDRQFRRLLQSDQATQQDWLNSNQFNREFNANLSMIPIASSADFLKYVAQLGAENPEVYTPNIMAGMQNFFTQSMLALLDQFMPD